MRVFVTGATGFVGSAVVRELLEAGHEVVGLARSDRSAEALTAAGAEAHRGALDDLDILRTGAAASQGVIHLAFKHDIAFSGDFQGAADADQRAIKALGEALAGSERPFVVTAGMAGFPAGRVATEEDAPVPGSPRVSEEEAMSFAGRGVRVSVVRLPPTVHGEGDGGFVPALINVARTTGVSGYPGDGSNRWPAVHRLDAAPLFRLALEAAPTGARLHAVGDEGVQTRDIAGVIGRHLELPVTAISPGEADGHFGWIGRFFSMDVLASSTLTRERMGWQPTHPALIPDLEEGHYFGD